ncbi:Acetyl esterase/lipase [Roseovarius litoreus]|uniref:Acetyl esterase/lipase n=1 Tax=Roseovarius litoreus TaxID=1155722 RepID=A0A1M7AAL1_9RHOB|nr:alpha/beta hydrolase [Roseovarius litoreus]SHL39686.1 Acetyl esterase/lipase [Roseovarius litoreus]
MSLCRPLLNLVLRLREKRFLAKVEDPQVLRNRFEQVARWLFWPPRGCHFSTGVLDGVPVTWARGAGASEDGPAMLFLHGGAFVFGSPRTHRAMLARLSERTGLPACLPSYRLAPEHPFPAALEDALSAYIALSAQRDVILGGDSAGGGLALALMAEILKHGLRKPLAVFCFSPLTDLTFSGASITANARADAVLPAIRTGELATMYLGDANPGDPRASPLFARFAGAPPVWMTVGDTEILLDDTRRMAERLREDGGQVTEVITRDLPHVWPIFSPLLPEATATLDTLADWINCRLPKTTGS